MRIWDVASGRQVRQLAGTTFALVGVPGSGNEGGSGYSVALYGGQSRNYPYPDASVGDCSDEPRRGRFVLTIRDDMLLMYRVASEREGGAAAAPPVACFKAPQRIRAVRCRGAAICVGCVGGAVCILSAPFLAA